MQSFDVTGMTCAHCVRAVTDGIHDVDPDAEVTVDLATGKVIVNRDSAPEDVLLEAFAKEGYQAVPTV